MVICIIALVAFSILGIWSAKYRRLAKEAFDCTFRMITFRPCVTKLDERIKSKVTSKLMRFPKLARTFYRNFKIFSWAFVIAFFVSMAYTAYGIYNLVVYGTCDPSSGSCVLSNGWSSLYGLLCKYEVLIVYMIIFLVLVALAYITYKYFKDSGQ